MFLFCPRFLRFLTFFIFYRTFFTSMAKCIDQCPCTFIVDLLVCVSFTQIIDARKSERLCPCLSIPPTVSEWEVIAPLFLLSPCSGRSLAARAIDVSSGFQTVFVRRAKGSAKDTAGAGPATASRKYFTNVLLCFKMNVYTLTYTPNANVHS